MDQFSPAGEYVCFFALMEKVCEDFEANCYKNHYKLNIYLLPYSQHPQQTSNIAKTLEKRPKSLHQIDTKSPGLSLKAGNLTHKVKTGYTAFGQD